MKMLGNNRDNTTNFALIGSKGDDDEKEESLKLYCVLFGILILILFVIWLICSLS